MQTTSLIALAAFCLLILYYFSGPLFAALSSHQRDIPGPLLARFTKLWYLYKCSLGRFEHVNIALHDQYQSRIIRIAPGWYSIKDPSALKTIYGLGTKFYKNSWYESWTLPGRASHSIFTQPDINMHAEQRRKLQSFYSMSTLVSYESYVDECAAIFRQRLSEFAKTDTTFDMGHWFQCYAFDVIGDMTYSKRFGFLDNGEDIDGALAKLNNSLRYSTLVGMYPTIHVRFFGILGRLGLSGVTARIYLTEFARERKKLREQGIEHGGLTRKKPGETDEDGPMDFLAKFLEAKKEAKGGKWTDWLVVAVTLGNVFAGSDTTGATLSAILYFLIRNPHALEKVRKEIKEAQLRGECGKEVVTFKESRALPYLQAVLKEAMRLHPATGLPLWRVVPEGGADIAGRHFQAGDTVGVNSWVSHYDEEVWGKDVRVFNPERWIDEKDESRLKMMEQCYMPFGLGSRTCMGRHISMLEMSKLIPQIVNEFDFELDLPGSEWSTKNYWFVKPTDFMLKVKLRQQKES